jgi:hypothetical protein
VERSSSAAGTPSFAATLTGTVTSAKEGAMEGVLVTAKKGRRDHVGDGRLRRQGPLCLPRRPPDSGHYNLKVRAIGYVLDGPRAVDVGNAATTADIKLNTTANIAPQMTNVEWLNSMPGTDAEKRDLIACAYLPYADAAACSRITRRISSRTTSSRGWRTCRARRCRASVQKRLVQRDQARTFGGLDRLANYLATVNLSSSQEHKFDLKGLPRPKGKATKVIITSYDLPRKTMQPHDSGSGG